MARCREIAGIEWPCVIFYSLNLMQKKKVLKIDDLYELEFFIHIAMLLKIYDLYK